jgi:hypothetical protein
MFSKYVCLKLGQSRWSLMAPCGSQPIIGRASQTLPPLCLGALGHLLNKLKQTEASCRLQGRSPSSYCRQTLVSRSIQQELATICTGLYF